MSTDDEEVRGRESALVQAKELDELYRLHHPAVLRVTQALLRQGADAQDAAQEAFLKAMQSAHGFRRDGPVRRWLLKIATNVATDEHRRAGARRAVDLARAPTLPSDPAVAAEGAEWERLLLRGLLGLGPELREPLVLRYWDDCSLTEISLRLKIPRSTADKRCRQGLAMLRDRLGPRGYGTLPLFLGTLPKVAAVLQSSALQPVLAGGVTLMVNKGIVAVAVVVIVSLPFLFTDWFSFEPGSTSPAVGKQVPDVGAAPGNARADADLKDADQAPIETTPFASPDEPPGDAGGWRVRGRVMLAGKPAPRGSVVEVRLHPGWWEAGESRQEDALANATVKVGENGGFVWSTERPEEFVTIVVRAAREGFMPATASELVMREAGPPQDLKLDLRPLDVTVEGTVRDGEGRPVAHPIVRCRRHEVTGDEQGRYRVRGTSHYAKQRVSAWAEGFAITREAVNSPAPGGSVQLDLVIDTGLVIEGRIVDAEGHPIANARVKSWDGRPHDSLTFADGVYRRTGFRRGRQASFEVHAASYVRRHVWVKEVVTDLKNHDIVLTRGSRVRGLVVDEQGAPVEGALIGVGQGFSMGGTLKTITDKDGRFRMEDVATGPVGIHVLRAGFVQLEASTVVPEPGVLPEELRLELRPGMTLFGRLIDGTGAPVAGARVIAKKGGDYLEASATTATDGTFDLADVAGPEVGIEIYRRGLVRLRETVQIKPDRVDIVVSRHGVVAGRVLDDATGQPIDRFRIRIRSASARPGERRASGYSAELADRGRWFAKSEGQFVIDDEELPPGVVLGLEAWAEGYAPVTAPRVFTTMKADPEAVILRLKRAAAMRGRVLDRADETPIAGARVRWRLADAPVRSWYDFDAEDAGVVSTGQDGSFRFDDLPPHPIRIEVDASGYPILREGPIAVPAPGGHMERILYVPRGAIIKGIIEDHLGAPAPGARVSLSATENVAKGGRRSHNAVADAAGAFRFTGLAPGRWRISREHLVGRYGVHLHGKDVDVSGSKTYEIRLRPEGDASLVLNIQSTIQLPRGTIVNAISLAKTEPRPTIRTAIVENGRANFAAIPAGRWRVSIRVLGGARSSALTGSLVVELESGVPQARTLQAEATRATR